MSVVVADCYNKKPLKLFIIFGYLVGFTRFVIGFFCYSADELYAFHRKLYRRKFATYVALSSAF